MSNGRRPSLMDWIAGILAGAALGFVFLGVGSRLGMTLIAILQGITPGYTLGGTATVVFLGVASGAAIGLIFMISRALFPARRVYRVALFTIVVSAFVLRGLRPISVLSFLTFVPLFIAHGALLHYYWCRFRLRARRADAALAARAS